MLRALGVLRFAQAGSFFRFGTASSFFLTEYIEKQHYSYVLIKHRGWRSWVLGNATNNYSRDSHERSVERTNPRWRRCNDEISA
jgi:hypothetical protein